MEAFFIQLLPIIIIYFFLAYTKDAVLFSNTILGRLVAVLFIAYYTNVDAVLGLFICVLIIYYYQTDLVEGMLNLSEGFGEPVKYAVQADSAKTISEIHGNTSYVIDNIPNNEISQEINHFKNDLMYKDSMVKPRMEQCIFTEIDYTDSNHSSDRKISFIEKKMNTENELLFPKNRNT